MSGPMNAMYMLIYVVIFSCCMNCTDLGISMRWMTMGTNILRADWTLFADASGRIRRHIGAQISTFLVVDAFIAGVLLGEPHCRLEYRAPSSQANKSPV